MYKTLYEGSFQPIKVDILDEEFEKPTHISDLVDVVESAIELAPKDKRTLRYKQWRDKVNEMVKEINKRKGFKYFIYMD